MFMFTCHSCLLRSQLEVIMSVCCLVMCVPCVPSCYNCKLLSPLPRMSEKVFSTWWQHGCLLQSHFLLNILPRSCPRNLLKSIRACICVSLVFSIFVLVFVFIFSQVDRSHFLLNILPLTVPAICRRVVYPSLSSTAELKPGWKQ